MGIGQNVYKLELCIEVDPRNQEQNDLKKMHSWFILPAHKEPQHSVYDRNWNRQMVE